NTADVVYLGGGTGSRDYDMGKVTYGYPYPKEWGFAGFAEAGFKVSYTLPNSRAYAAGVWVWYQDVMDRFTAQTIVLPISPVQTPLVDAASPGKAQPIAATPHVSWSPPATGKANGYIVLIYHLFIDSGVTHAEYVAEVFTADTEVVIPPGLL